MKISKFVVVAIFTSVLLVGCATPPKVAQNKFFETQGQKFDFGGVYHPKKNELILSVNGDPIMKGSFPPFTPTKKLNSSYKTFQITAECYFGSILGSERGLVGVIAGAVQSGHGKTADKCDLFVDSKPAESLYF